MTNDDLSMWGRRVELDSGEVIPPWWYGRSYNEDARRLRGAVVFHPIPINLVVRAWLWARVAWARLRCRPSWFDARLEKAQREAFERGIEFGRQLERREIIDRARDLLDMRAP